MKDYFKALVYVAAMLAAAMGLQRLADWLDG